MRKALKFLPRVGRRPICKLIVFVKWMATCKMTLVTPHRQFCLRVKGREVGVSA